MTGTYGASVYSLILQVNGMRKETITGGNSGIYRFTNISGYITKATDDVVIIATDEGGKEVRVIGVNILEYVSDYRLDADTYTFGEDALTGLFGRDISRIRLWVNGKVMVQAVTSNGKYTITKAANYIQNASDLVELVGVDSNYTEVQRIQVNIQLKANFTLLVDPYKLDDEQLTGRYGADIHEVRLVVDGKTVAQATKAGGQFTIFNAANLIKNADITVFLVAVDTNYSEVNRIRATIYDQRLTNSAYMLGSTSLTGTYGRDIFRVQLWVNGKAVSFASTKNGNYSWLDVQKTIVKVTDKIEVLALDQKNKIVNRLAIKIIDYTLTNKAYKFGTSELTGTFGKDCSRVRLAVNGSIVAQATLTGNTYLFKDCQTIIKKSTDKVELIAVDNAYTVVSRKVVEIGK